MYFYIISILLLIRILRIFFIKPQLRLVINGFNLELELNFALFKKWVIIRKVFLVVFKDWHYGIYYFGKLTDNGHIKIKPKKKKKKEKDKVPLKKILEGFKFSNWIANVEIGAHSADKTALLAGSIMSLFAAYNAKKPEKNKINYKIHLNFERVCFHVEAKCIIKVRIVHIIYVLLFERSKKHGKASNRKHYDNHVRKSASHG